ncbi:Predicted nuclease of the RNAse H fold, HicB family [Peptoniphilus asaccharolyticus DSM 20463]|uniref:Predicted nuclease of the RNAse H fold, HicB family n=1 Tax=Peptoniphilus asaccharolyticus DSM 20463 TaxID=573058 RepID=A0A1W1V1E8_PEPAS|nr:type II toxin-antitoxin system HicB family antitoxin [Peptoniphilus asaccharolyticus]MBL7575537.1 type II toxin-antitoxin system HicB family antitoxin [Peptoniphilus asaccharolyticus]SMB87175.1 Predicted nuclease of the RNAse H fold, HicB family [Peptoniphilus asaccharolyticus DSM 20463]
MLVSYPALFYYSPSEDNSYFVYFPDLGGTGTQGETIEDALFMASDYLGIVIADIVESGEKLPKRTDMNKLSLIDDFPFKDDKEFDGFYDLEQSFVSMVCVDIEKYFESQKLVKKTLNIPKWSNDIGNRLNLNFSKVLTEAIQEIALR